MAVAACAAPTPRQSQRESLAAARGRSIPDRHRIRPGRDATRADAKRGASRPQAETAGPQAQWQQAQGALPDARARKPERRAVRFANSECGLRPAKVPAAPSKVRTRRSGCAKRRLGLGEPRAGHKDQRVEPERSMPGTFCSTRGALCFAADTILRGAEIHEAGARPQPSIARSPPVGCRARVSDAVLQFPGAAQPAPTILLARLRAAGRRPDALISQVLRPAFIAAISRRHSNSCANSEPLRHSN